MTKRNAATSYTLARVTQLLGLDRRSVTALVDAGLLRPTRGPRNEYRFSFQDVVLLRTARRLRQSNISHRSMLRSFRHIQSSLADDTSLSGVRIKAVGNQVAVGDGVSRWNPESGQLLLDLENAEVEGHPATEVAAFGVADADVAPAVSDSHWYTRADALESLGDLAGAEEAYRQALAINPRHAFTYINLGALLCESGRSDAAVELYDSAIRACPVSADIHYNRGLALEDRGRIREALASYEYCLTLDPTLADAHFNAARLHQKLGQAQGAIRHFSAYKRLTK